MGRRSLTAVLMVTVFLVVSASAAGSTAVSVTPSEAEVVVDEDVTLAIAVETVDRGVGAVEASLTLGTPRVANITGVRIKGDPGLSNVEMANDSSSVSVEAALMDTADSGTVTIMIVNITAVEAGSTKLDLEVPALGDEEGASYEVTEVRDAELTVDGGKTETETTATESPTPTPSPEQTPQETPTPTAVQSDTLSPSPTPSPSPKPVSPTKTVPTTADAPATASPTPTDERESTAVEKTRTTQLQTTTESRSPTTTETLIPTPQEPTSPIDLSSPTTGSTPGFGVMIALLGFLSYGLLLIRRS